MPVRAGRQAGLSLLWGGEPLPPLRSASLLSSTHTLADWRGLGSKPASPVTYVTMCR